MRDLISDRKVACGLAVTIFTLEMRGFRLQVLSLSITHKEMLISFLRHYLALT